MINPNDSAYPIVQTMSHDGKETMDATSNGFTKKEEALLRFMCSIVSGTCMRGTFAEWSCKEISSTATELTEAYFNELNKQSQ